MRAFNEIAISSNAVLYIDDAHGTGVLGERGRGTVLEALGSYDNTFVVGSPSKAFSCAGGFIACSRVFQKILEMRSNTYIFGGPVVPAYLDGICTVVDILQSNEYPPLRAHLDRHVDRLSQGLAELDLVVSGGATPILSVSVGDEVDTLRAGKSLFDQGSVQSVLFPAVPYHGGVIRVQCNSNHTDAEIDGLIAAFAALKLVIRLPLRSQCPGTTAKILRKVYAYLPRKSRDDLTSPSCLLLRLYQAADVRRSFRTTRFAPSFAAILASTRSRRCPTRLTSMSSSIASRMRN